MLKNNFSLPEFVRRSWQENTNKFLEKTINRPKQEIILASNCPFCFYVFLFGVNVGYFLCYIVN
jgi:hypothetical protein